MIALGSRIHAMYQKSNNLAFLTVALLTVVMKIPTLNNNILFTDEAAYLVQGNLLNSLQKFVFAFQYRTETKFQLGCLPYMLAEWINQPQAILVLHIFGVITMILSGWLLVLIAQLCFNTPLPGIFAILMALIFQGSSATDSAVLLEYFQTPLILLSIWLFLRIIKRPDRSFNRMLLWIGLSIGAATLIKTSAIAIVPSFSLVLLFFNWPELELSKKETWLGRIKALAILAAGVIFPIALTIFPYLFNAAAFAEFKFSLIDQSIDYAETTNASLLERIIALVDVFFGAGNLLIVVIAALVALVTAIYKQKYFRITLKYSDQVFLSSIAILLLIGFAPGRAKPHYLISIIPIVMLVVGFQLISFYQFLTKIQYRYVFLGFIAVWLMLLEFPSFLSTSTILLDTNPTYYQAQIDVNEQNLVQYIQTNTQADDYIWVYYAAPEIYWLSDRQGATNEPTNSFVTDLQNTVWYNRTTEQLKRDQPKLIIGIDHPHYADATLPDVTQFPASKDLIAANYSCSRDLVPKTTICTLTKPIQ